jgi:hypothetical protein
MCFESELDRRVHDEDKQAREEIRRLFERYRAASHREAAANGDVGVDTTHAVSEQEPALASH